MINTIGTKSQLNLVPSLLDRLQGEGAQVGTARFEKGDFKDFYRFAWKLRTSPDPLSQFLRDQLSHSLQEELAQWQENESLSQDLSEKLIDELNNMIDQQLLYTPRRFRHIILSKKIRRILDEPIKEKLIIWVNRWLLEEAYQEIHKKNWEYIHSYHLEKLLQHVARDLANLLNTRWEWHPTLPEQYQRIPESLLKYGLPDITTLSLQNEHDCQVIVEEVKLAIRYFEPRLQSIDVSLIKEDENVHTLKLRIDALLRIKPIPQPVVFDAVLQWAELEGTGSVARQPMGSFIVEGHK